MSKIVCLIQARATSKRFKNKVFKKILGLSLLEIIYKRICTSKLLSNIFFLIPNNHNNKILENFLLNKKIPFFKGSEKNVLDRYLKCSKKINPTIIIRVTADCPLIDGILLDKCLKNFIKFNYDYLCSRDGAGSLPDGLDVEVFKAKILNNLSIKNLNQYELEHVTPAIRKLIKVKKIIDFGIKKKIKKKYSIDNYYNYKNVKKIFMKEKKIKFNFNRTIELLLNNEK